MADQRNVHMIPSPLFFILSFIFSGFQSKSNRVLFVTKKLLRPPVSCTTRDTLNIFPSFKAFAFVNAPIIIGTISMLLGTLIAMTDVPVLNLYFIGEPYKMSITGVGMAV